MLTELASPLETKFLDFAGHVSAVIEPALVEDQSWYNGLLLLVGAARSSDFEEAEAHFTLVHDMVLEQCDFGAVVTHRERLAQNLDVMMSALTYAANQKPGAVSAEALDAVRSNLRYAQMDAEELKVMMLEVDQICVLLQRHFVMLAPWSVRNFSSRSRAREHVYRAPLLELAKARDVVLESHTDANLDSYLTLVPDVVNALLLEEIISDSKAASFCEALETAAAKLQVAVLMESMVVSGMEGETAS